MSSGGSPALSIVIPAYNEAKRLPATLETVLGYLDAESLDAEILVVDDGSSDDTRRVAEASGDARVRVLDYGGNRGKGYAVRTGMLAAAGQRVLFSDADLSTPIEELAKLNSALDDGADIAIASRAVLGADVQKSQSGFRKYGGKVFNLAVRILLPLPFQDTQCGFKLFSREAAQEIFQRARFEGFSFDVEVLFLALRLGYATRELPVRWVNSEDTKVRFLRDASLMLRDVLRIRIGSLTGKYPRRLSR